MEFCLLHKMEDNVQVIKIAGRRSGRSVRGKNVDMVDDQGGQISTVTSSAVDDLIKIFRGGRYILGKERSPDEDRGRDPTVWSSGFWCRRAQVLTPRVRTPLVDWIELAVASSPLKQLMKSRSRPPISFSDTPSRRFLYVDKKTVQPHNRGHRSTQV
jgi:hypothetical protein